VVEYHGRLICLPISGDTKRKALKDIIIAIIGALATISAALIGYAAAKKK